MAYARKKQGYRTLTVDAQRYRWRLQPSTPDSLLVIHGPASGRQELIVTLRDWQDPIFAIDGFRIVEGLLYLHTSAHNEPAAITPRFVRQAIRYGLRQGWTPQRAALPLHVEYARGAWSVRAD